MDGITDGSQGHKAIVMLGGVREIIPHPHFALPDDEPHWQIYAHNDALLVSLIYGKAERLGLDAEFCGQPSDSNLWTLRIFASEAQLNDIVQTAGGLPRVVPEQLGGLL